MYSYLPPLSRPFLLWLSHCLIHVTPCLEHIQASLCDHQTLGIVLSQILRCFDHFLDIPFLFFTHCDNHLPSVFMRLF
nr:MAG TPA: hypothetical protein [Caudoviricetes sp.]